MSRNETAGSDNEDTSEQTAPGSSHGKNSRFLKLVQKLSSRPHHGAAGPPRVGKFEQKATVQEAKNYDFKAARGPQKTTNVFESMAHLIKGCLGAGIVSIHESYKMCGLWSSLVLNFILGFLVSYCMYILLKSAQKMYGRIQEPKMSYPDLAEAALAIGPFPRLRRFDKCFRYAVDLTITLDLFGSCCVYMVIIARTIKQLMENTDETNDDGVRWYILALTLPCIFITWILELKYLAPLSIVANFFIATVVFSTVYYGVTSAPAPPTEYPIFKTVEGLFEFMGGCVFSMEGVGVSMAIENTMTVPTRYPLVIIGGMSTVVLMVVLVGFFGYWGFGEASFSPVTLNFPMSWYPMILKVMMALMVWVTFALNFWVPFDLVWYYIKQKHNPQKYWFWERLYRSLFVILVTAIAIIFPNVSSFIGLLGAFCLSNMGFIYPAFIELCLDWHEPGLGFMKWRLWKCVAICTFGFVLMICGTYSSLKNMIITVYY